MTDTVQAHVLFSRRACAARRAAILVAAILACSPARAGLDEFRIKREAVFEFVRKPRVTQAGDRITIAFETKGFCDVTIAIEEAVPEGVRNPRRVPDTLSGRIVRHLASGVLGPNAPEPFQRNSKKQSIIWDGKDDQGTYIDDWRGLTIRVSLGLKARFERNLNWSPERRVSDMPPIMRPTEEGVYVYEGRGLDHLRLFDHEGNYVRTLHPFERRKLERIDGLRWFNFPQGDRLPLKIGSYQQTFLTSGDNAAKNGMGGSAATAMAVHPDGRIALVHERLNRLSTDGTTGGRPLLGPVEVKFPFRTYGTNADRAKRGVVPTSAAFSPDGKWVYLTGYAWRIVWHFDILHGLVRIPYETDGPLKVFAGSMKQDDKGTDNAHFNGATSVACDKAGRVYVSDLANDRIQVFAPDGTHLKTIPAAKPAQVEIHPRTQEIWVFSWPVYTRAIWKHTITPSVTRFGPFEDPRKIASYPLPWPTYKGRHNEWWDRPPLVYRAALDGWSDPPTIWIAGGIERSPLPWHEYNIRLLRQGEGKLEVVRDFGKEVIRASGRARYAPFNYQMQRLKVNPKTGRLLLLEPDSGPAIKAYNQLVEFDPETGKPTLVDLPFNPEDVAFDLNGLIYLRSTDVVVRYDPETWREMPWDYGVELPRVTCGEGGRAAPVVGGLVIPSTSPVCFHQGGIAVSPKGHLAVSCAYRQAATKRSRHRDRAQTYAKRYTPTLYPGRMLSSTSACVHIWDERGRVIHEDAVQGMPQIDGLGIDRDDNLYVLATPTRMLDGKRYFNKASETLMRLKPGESRFISSSNRAKVPLPKTSHPKRPPDVSNYGMQSTWVEGAAWMYGGVGFAGFNDPGCACWHARFTLDYFARSFAPEMDQYRVAVLDKNGNLIMRIGRYGNMDDGMPLIRDGGPPNPRSIGGDEVALFYGAYLATHTDRRLFIADIGNARIVSVKLDYHTSERVMLKNMTEGSE